ncbi:MAG TPA: flagellar filament capping protein FliD [Noviherbaspirillum sp.]|nr:flagellar filament capping protein FliD [Noviherbaspirillum sp.]
MGISSPGIGSNLDINGIVSKLMQAESQPLATLQKKEASYQAKLSAYGSLSGSLSSLQTALGALNNLSTFQGVNATSADTTIFTASAASSASAGTYNVNVTQLAQAQTIASAGQTSTTTTIGAGTATKLTFQFGTISGGTLTNGTYSGASFTPDANHATVSVTIDNTNNSLQGIRDAINKANIGVTASIVSDGSATPNHLVIKSNSTGATSSMKISVTAPDGTPGGDAALSSLLAYDPTATQNMTQSAAGQSAALTVNGIAITSATNTVTGAIDGATLNLVKVGSSNLTVAANTAAATSAVNGFVKAYNDLNKTIKSLTSYDAATKQAGLLLGDATVNNIQSQLRKVMSSPLTDSSGSLTTLSQVGISIDKSGVMSLDSGKLSSAMGTSMKDVTALFSSIGTSTDSLVKYDSSTSATTPGDYAVYISKLATQGNVTGTNAVAATTNINSSNKDLTLTVNGVTASMSLVESTYTSPSALAAQVQSAINGASAFSSAGIAVSVTIDAAGKMVITSNKYGSDSKVSITGSAVAPLLGTATATDGIDVAGTIGGIAATGTGQFLSGALGSTTQGLKLQITGGLEMASRGTVTFSRGYAHILNGQIDGYLGSSGLLNGRTDGIKRSITDIDKQTESLNNRLADIEKRYRAQFTALDVTISKMNSTSTYLTQQLAQISNLSK